MRVRKEIRACDQKGTLNVKGSLRNKGVGSHSTENAALRVKWREKITP